MNRLDRRQLVGLGGAALVGAGLGLPTSLAHGGPSRPVRDGGRGRNIRKALKIGMIQVEGSLEEKFLAAAELGFDGVEMDSPNELAPEEVLAAKEESGLAIPGVVDSVHWRDTLGDPDPEVRARGVAGLETALRDAKTYGASTVLLVPAVVRKDIRYDEAYTRSQTEIRRVLPLAEELGVSIAIENVWNQFLLSPVEAARYVDELESEHVGWFMDIGNVVNYGWPEQWIRILGDRILKLDFKEFSRKKRNDEGLWKGFCELGEGDCDWPAVMAALDEIGYEGWASAEVGGGDRERLAAINAWMDGILAS
jgi:hexulose-6-phosphate isomerase